MRLHNVFDRKLLQGVLLAVSMLALTGCWSVFSTNGKDFLQASPVQAVYQDRIATPMYLAGDRHLVAFTKQSPTIIAHEWLKYHLHPGATSLEELILLIGEPHESRFEPGLITARWSFESVWDKGYYWITTSKRSGEGELSYTLEVQFRPEAPSEAPLSDQLGQTITLTKFDEDGHDATAAQFRPFTGAFYAVSEYSLSINAHSTQEHDFNPMSGVKSGLSSGAKKAIGVIK